MKFTTTTAFTATIATTTAVISLMPGADAHGILLQPAANFKPGVMRTNYLGTITGQDMGGVWAGKKWNDNPDANARTFTETYKQAGIKSVREIIDARVKDCGNTVMDGAPVDVSNMHEVKWANPDVNEGFINSHTGPCEVWVNDERILHEENCPRKFTGNPAVLPADLSKACKGKCQLTFYWLALHEPQWQMYKNCVPIISNSFGFRGLRTE